MVSLNHRYVVGDVDGHAQLGRNRGARRVARELSHVHFGTRSFRQSSELREAFCDRLESLRLDREHLDRFAEFWRDVATKTVHREANRCERILELVRDLPRGLSQRRGAFGLERARATQLQLFCHFAHSRAKHLEFRRASARWSVGQGLCTFDGRSPTNELGERTAQVSTQVPRDSQRDDADDEHHKQGREHQLLRGATEDEFRLPRQHRTLAQRFFVIFESGALSGSQWRGAKAVDRSLAAHRRAVPGSRVPEKWKHERTSRAPGERDEDRRNECEGQQDEKEAAAESDTLHQTLRTKGQRKRFRSKTYKLDHLAPSA